MAGFFEEIIRSNRLRLAFATGMAALGLWAFAPYVTSEVGGEAYVNAPIIRMASPIAGLVATDLPPPGTAIVAERTARLVAARVRDTGPLSALKGQQAALLAARDLARRQIAEIAAADHRLASRSARFGQAASARLAATTHAAEEALGACEAEAAEAILQRDRVEALAAQRFATFTQRDRLRALAAASARRCGMLKDQASALTIETRAANSGLYLAGAAMDAPYGDQQRDRLLLRRQELESVAADAEARLAELAVQITSEEERLARASSFDAVLPAGTVVWSQPAPKGSTVAPGSSLLELADCRRRYVEVTLPERRMEAVLPGAPVQVRLIGSEDWLEGRVASAVGAAARRDGAMLAANPDKDARALRAGGAAASTQPGASLRCGPPRRSPLSALVMLPDLDTAPALLVAAPLLLTASCLLLAPLFGLNRSATRTAVVAGVALVVGVYLHWRFTTTIPWDAPWVGLGFALTCLAIELFGLFDAAILFAALLKRTNRSAEADAGEARLAQRDPADWPAVDLIIATYNEPIEVLEKTILGALALDWPNLNVWVADDGRRAWLRDFCQAKGAGYITRPDNLHAKAGNINHALKVTHAPFVAVFDADFVPQRPFLRRTMGFFEDPAIGIVQVPHSFYNHDPLQQNLALREALPDDQRFFFEAIMPGRDGWDAAFCCGSNSITRRTALEAIGGGLPAGSITEDMLLSLALLQKGYVTRYLNEPLAFGLAPESLEAFFVQRARWAQGATQILFLDTGPLGRGHAWQHRLFFLPTAWLSQCLMLMASLIAPLVFLFFDVPPLVGVTAQSAIFFLVPMVFAQVGGIVLLGGGRYFPTAAQVLGTFQSFRLLPVIIKTLFKPHGHAFKVTPKGSDATGGGYQRGIFFACTGLMIATLAGLVINAFPDTRIVMQGALVPMVAFWGLVNVVVLFLAAMLCLGRPALRAEERFSWHEPVAIWRRDARNATLARGIDISVSGIALEGDGVDVGEPVRVRLRGLGSIEGQVARARNGRIGIAFNGADSPARDRLIVQLFTRGMNATQLQVPLWRATRTMLARILTADMRLPTAPTGQAATRPELSDDRLEKRTYVLPPENRTPATMRLARAS